MSKNKMKNKKWIILKCCICGKEAAKMAKKFPSSWGGINKVIAWCDKHIGLEIGTSTTALFEIKEILEKYHIK